MLMVLVWLLVTFEFRFIDATWKFTHVRIKSLLILHIKLDFSVPILPALSVVKFGFGEKKAGVKCTT